MHITPMQDQPSGSISRVDNEAYASGAGHVVDFAPPLPASAKRMLDDEWLSLISSLPVQIRLHGGAVAVTAKWTRCRPANDSDFYA